MFVTEFNQATVTTIMTKFNQATVTTIMTKFNQAIGEQVNRIGKILMRKINSPQNAVSVLQGKNAACEDMKLKLQGQLQTLQESLIFRWFSRFLPEAPPFGEYSGVASQDGLLGRWLQRCPGIKGLWKARGELKRCELGLRQMETQALRFNEQLKSTWFFGKLLTGFDIGERTEILSQGNKKIYIGVAAAVAVIGAMYFTVRRMATEDEDGVPEMEEASSEHLNLLSRKETETEYLDKTTQAENHEDENEKLQGQLNELKSVVEELKAEREKTKADNASEIKRLETKCSEKNLRMTEQEKLLKVVRTEKEEMKKVQIEKMEQLNQLKSEVDGLKAEKEKLIAEKASDYQKVEKECAEKDLKITQQKHFLEILKTENEDMRQGQNEKRAQLINLRNEVEELKTEKEKHEKLKAEKMLDYQKLEKECAEKDLRIKELETLLSKIKNENEEVTKEEKKKSKQVNQLEREVNELKTNREKHKNMMEKNTSAYQTLEEECKKKNLRMKDQEKLLETLKKENLEMKKVIKEKTENKEKEKRGALLKNGLFAQMNNRVKEAIDIYTEALAMETDREEETALLHVLRAEANAATKNPPNMDIILDCCEAIKKGLEGWKVYMLRGRHLLKLGLYDAAQKDFETANKKKSEKCGKFIEDTKALKKKWEDQGHYEVLGVEQTAKKADIIKSFRDLSMMFHPDRHRDKPEFLQEAFEEKYKRVVNAKLILVDEESRREYDAELRRNSQWQSNQDGASEYHHWGWNNGRQYHQEHPRQQRGPWNQHRQYYHEESKREQGRKYHEERRRQRDQGNDHQYYY